MLAVSLLVAVAPASTGEISGDLPSVEPEAIGWSAEKLEELTALVEELGYCALMLVHDGRVFLSWGEVDRNYKLHSIRKPLLGALYGIHAQEGTVDLDLTLGELEIDDLPSRLSETEKEATIRQLLQSRSGVYHPAAGETQQMKDERPERGSHAPGTFFYYNNWDFNVLGSVFRQLTGKDVFVEFHERIGERIGMQDFDPSLCYYYEEPELSQHSLYAFRMSARDLARFGVLVQKGGTWNGNQVVPKRWLEESSTPYSTVAEGSGMGFGYLWGTLSADSQLGRMLGCGGVFFSGIGVHNLLVLPEAELVMVIRMDTDGAFEAPDPAGNRLLFTLIGEARPK